MSGGESINVDRAKKLGEQAGCLDAVRWKVDSEDFEESANPFGLDSEPDFHEAWAEGYENQFELCK